MPGNIFLTGASRGIGAVVALELARRGHTVGCFSRGGRGPENVDVPADLKPRLVPLKGDVLDREAVRAAFDAFARAAGPLSGVVNNAGVHIIGPSDRQPLEEFETIMRTNASSVFSICQDAYPRLVAAGGGLIVNIGSFFEKLGVRQNAAYCASKAAVGAITRCLAVEWAPKKIRVVAIAPGYIETDLNKDYLASESVRARLAARIPVGGPGKPENVARLIGALYDEDIPFLTGETIRLDGAHSLAL